MNNRMKKILGVVLVLGAVLVLLAATLLPPCWSALNTWGMLIPRCPAGEPRVLVQLSTYGVERGREGTVSLQVDGSWIDGDAERISPLNGFSWSMELDTGEQVHPLECEDASETDSRGYRSCQVVLPEDVPDGDHILRVHVNTHRSLEDPVVELTLPLYAPAHVHVLTDRPLYEPGNVILFRSLSLRRGSLEPLDSRPGSWIVSNPSGEVLLEERIPGGPWGIAHSSFPLAMDAESGTWTVTWQSGSDSGSSNFEVRPFTLPRFTVDAQPSQSWYGKGDAPIVRGVVSYTSGAPVQGATVELSVRSGGDWPPPTEWLGPHTVETDASGSFRLELPDVPDDLHTLTNLSVQIAAIDTDGDRVQGATALLLSPDPLKVDAVTELGDGLVSDFNNRVYLRVSTPDGMPLANTSVFLKNAWDVRDEGKNYTTDEDGVLAAQLDPGQPVNVIIPAAPVRPPPRSETRKVNLVGVEELLSRRQPSLAERRDLELIGDRLESCARFGPGSRSLGVEVLNGRISKLSSDNSEGQMRCIVNTLAGRSLGSGDGVWRLEWRFTEPTEQTWLRLDTKTVTSAGNVSTLLDRARRDATACVSERRKDATPPFQLVWSVEEGSTRISTRWADNPSGAGAWPEAPCIRRAFSTLELNEPAASDLLGVSVVRVDAWQPPKASGPRTTTLQGFEYLVRVEDRGETTWHSTPGMVPALRLRPDKVLLEPGSSLTIEMLRGPDWVGELPSQLSLQGHAGTVQTCPRTPELFSTASKVYAGCPDAVDDNTVLFQLPADQTGFMLVEYSGARAVVYVQPTSTLEVELSTALTSYAPGSEAVLQVQTSQPAVVSIVGVDQTLGQLAPLTGPDDLSNQLVPASSSSPAYGTWDAVALTSGRIRGNYAAMAAIQRVDSVVLAEVSLPWLTHSASSDFDAVEETTSTFWEILADLHDGVRAWEADAPQGELLTNELLAQIYGEVLDRRDSEGLPYTDPWERRLELYLLPESLLALCEPRVLVRDATRVPEDVVNWTHWVHWEMER